MDARAVPDMYTAIGGNTYCMNNIRFFCTCYHCYCWYSVYQMVKSTKEVTMVTEKP